MSENENAFAIGEVKGKVVITMPKLCQEIVMDPETARQAGEALARHSYTARYGVIPEQHISTISNEKREMLATRLKHILRSMTEKQRSPDHIVREIMDTVLAEIL